jgi:hypothetical protein
MTQKVNWRSRIKLKNSYKMLVKLKKALIVFEKNISEIMANYQNPNYKPAFIPVHMNNKIKNKAKRF